jgi:anoctamin-7
LPLLCKYAEELNLRAPLQVYRVLNRKNFKYYSQAHPNPSGNWSEWLLAKLYIPNAMSEEVPNKPLDYYTCPFKMSKLDRSRIKM